MRFVAVALLIAISVTAAHAAKRSRNEWIAIAETCDRADDHAAQIEACSKLIDDHSLPKEIVGPAYGQRAMARSVLMTMDKTGASKATAAELCSKIDADFDKAVELDADPRAMRVYRGRHLIGVFGCPSRPDSAIEDLNFALARPDGEWQELALHWRAEAFYRKEDYQSALTDLTALLALAKPDSRGEAFGRRGNVYLILKRNDLAIEDLTKAIKAKPDVKEYYIDRGKAYARSGRTEEATADAEQVRKLDPSDADARALLNSLSSSSSPQPANGGASSSPPTGSPAATGTPPVKLPETALFKRIDNFGEAFERIRSDYVDDVDDAELLNFAVEAIENRVPGLSNDETVKGAKRKIQASKGQKDALYAQLDAFGEIVEIAFRMQPPTQGGQDVIAAAIDAMEAHLSDMGASGGKTLEGSTPGAPAGAGAAVNREKGKSTIVDVAAARLDGDVAYLRITTFKDGTEARIVEAIQAQQNGSGGKLRGIVLDLRQNTGGLLDQAVAAADDFLDNGVIVTLRGRTDISVKVAKPGEIAADIPIAIIIDNETASGAEVFAAALKENGRAKLFGTRSAGTGVVKTHIPMTDGSELVLTTARLYRPSGGPLVGNGLKPDVEMASDAKGDGDVQLETVLRELGGTNAPPKSRKGSAANLELFIAPIIGPTPSVAAIFSAAIKQEMEHRGFTTSDGSDHSALTVRTYVVATKGAARVNFIADVTDKSGKRVHRISGDQPMPPGQNLDTIDERTVKKVANVIGHSFCLFAKDDGSIDCKDP